MDDSDLKTIEDHLEEASKNDVKPKKHKLDKVYNIPPEIMERFFGKKKI